MFRKLFFPFLLWGKVKENKKKSYEQAKEDEMLITNYVCILSTFNSFKL